MYKNLKEVELIIRKMAGKINAPEVYLPTFDYIEGDATPCIYVDSKGYHYIISERGTETDHDIFYSIDDLLNEVFQDVTFPMACDYEVNNRIESQDNRILMWSYQLELLGQLDQTFVEKCQAEIDEILKKHPYSSD